MRALQHVRWFEDVGIDDRLEVGGKGASLGELTRAGIAVPPGFVVTTGAFERFIDELERETPVRSRVESLSAEDLAAIGECSKELRERIERVALPQDVVDQIAAAHEALRSRGAAGAAGAAGATGAVAVRSSATAEDAKDASFAGLQDTYLWVAGTERVLESVRSCWASLYSVESVSYRRKRGMSESGIAMAVVVQTMVDARTAGVMFTRSPTTGDRSVITIEAAWGLGSAVVGGEVTPDRWVVGKITGEISVREVSDKTIRHAPSSRGGIEAVPVEDHLRRIACLSDDDLQVLRMIGRNIERHYGHAQDIEWAIDRHSGDILLLQSRPETVWSAREAAPAARAADDPLSHVMTIFGGRR